MFYYSCLDRDFWFKLKYWHCSLNLVLIWMFCVCSQLMHNNIWYFSWLFVSFLMVLNGLHCSFFWGGGGYSDFVTCVIPCCCLSWCAPCSGISLSEALHAITLLWIQTSSPQQCFALNSPCHYFISQLTFPAQLQSSWNPSKPLHPLPLANFPPTPPLSILLLQAMDCLLPWTHLGKVHLLL